MDKIKFDDVQDLKWRILLVLSVLLTLLGLMGLQGFLESTPIDNPKIYNRIMNVGVFIIGVISFREIWYKNYVRLGTQAIHIKINSFFGKSIYFSDIKSVLFESNKLKIDVIGGKKIIEFDLGKIERNDRQLLYEILRKKLIKWQKN